MVELRQLTKSLIVQPGTPVSLKNYDPAWTGHIREKEVARRLLRQGIQDLTEHQRRLYAHNSVALLIIFQAMDAAGKDSTIRHVMSGVNPQGCQVYSFKQPSAEERDHGYLWRSMKALPEKGRIGIHNRSYYEEVLVVRVHPELLMAQRLPETIRESKGIWRQRFDQINGFEKYLVANGVVVLKFYLNVSRREQKKRFLERIDRPDKNWKFSQQDVRERAFWKDYMRAYQDMFTHTSTKWAPWYIVPADHKWFTRVAVAGVINQTLEDLDLQYPKFSAVKRKDLLAARRLLVSERG
jgi:PPK2 family polyphosphate:nucleotide phosphotransferase